MTRWKSSNLWIQHYCHRKHHNSSKNARRQKLWRLGFQRKPHQVPTKEGSKHSCICILLPPPPSPPPSLSFSLSLSLSIPQSMHSTHAGRPRFAGGSGITGGFWDLIKGCWLPITSHRNSSTHYQLNLVLITSKAISGVTILTSLRKQTLLHKGHNLFLLMYLGI